jgi:hypothetical protein
MQLYLLYRSSHSLHSSFLILELYRLDDLVDLVLQRGNRTGSVFSSFILSSTRMRMSITPRRQLAEAIRLHL